MLLKEKFDFYDNSALKAYNLNESCRYQLSILGSLDNVTRAHSERVGNLCCRLCDYLHLSKDFTVYCATCGYIHDIGKQFIPPAVLQKPARLTDEEYKIIQRHTVIGYKICMEDPQLRPFVAGPHWHHEALDGSGYPDKLKGLQVPLEDQIIRVADEYDALVNKRQYKSHIGITDTFKILVENVKKGQNNRMVTKALKKLIIDDTYYEMASVYNYIDYINENLKRFKYINKYGYHMEKARTEKRKEYYAEGMKLLFDKDENLENYKDVYNQFCEALKKKQEQIRKLNQEIKELKAIRI